jgi:hypothetical protein
MSKPNAPDRNVAGTAVGASVTHDAAGRSQGQSTPQQRAVPSSQSTERHERAAAQRIVRGLHVAPGPQVSAPQGTKSPVSAQRLPAARH